MVLKELPKVALLAFLVTCSAQASAGYGDGDDTPSASSPAPCYSSSKNLINYLALHSCLDSRPWLSVPSLLAFVFLAFYILSQTAQHYFSPVVSKLAHILHLSPSTGGVTLLALGNGAPDVFASIAAVWGGNPRIGLGAIVSAGFFVTAFVVGFVALAAAPFSVVPLHFVRDICFYIVAVALMFVVYMSGEVYVWQAVALVALYILFVIVVIYMDQASGKSTGFKTSLSEVGQNLDRRRMDAASDPEVGDESHKTVAPIHSNGLHIVGKEKFDVEVGNVQSAHQRIEQSKELVDILVRLVSPVLSRFLKQVPKIKLLWKWPVDTILRSTIPAVDPSNWNRFYASCNLVFCPLILLYIISSAVSPHKRMVFLIPGVNFPVWVVVLLQGFVLGTVHFYSAKEPPETELLFAILTAFLMSVFWISFIAGELLGCLAALGVVLKVPPALLGLTVLAWGNSVGDLVTDVAVARAGQPAMAMAGCFAGPMFNMLVGFGVALAMKSAGLHPSPYRLEFNPSIVTAFCFLFATLLGSLFVIAWSKFQVPRFWGFCLIGLYIVFVVVSVATANLS